MNDPQLNDESVKRLAMALPILRQAQAVPVIVIGVTEDGKLVLTATETLIGPKVMAEMLGSLASQIRAGKMDYKEIDASDICDCENCQRRRAAGLPKETPKAMTTESHHGARLDEAIPFVAMKKPEVH